MKKMRRLLAVVLAFAMCLSLGTVSFAFDDVKDGSKVSEAVGILSNLGIIQGFEDGTFRPEDSVTRAQMAAIICRTLGYEEQAQGSAGTTAFVDVAGSHWASGYINVAQSLGIINGYGWGYFGPEDKVTYEQAVKMLVVALGYELDAQSKGGWPNGYLAVASREGITKNTGGNIGTPANRGTIAVLVYNSLEVRLMDQQTWTTNGGDEYGKTDETILSQYLGVQKWEGVVASAPYYEYAQNGYSDDDDQLLILEDAFYTEYDNGKLEKQEGYIGEIDCSLVQNANTLVGKKVVAYIGEEEDDNTGNRMVYALAEKQGANKSTKISATQLVKSGEKYYGQRDVIGYREVGGSRINTIDLDDDVEVIVNYGAGDSETIRTTADFEDVFDGKSGTIEFISNDANSKIDYILATVYDAEAVIEEVQIEDEMIVFNTYTGDLEEIDTEDEDTLVVVIRDGEIASVEDIEENDTVSVVGSDDFADGFRMLCVSSKVAVGSVNSYDDEVVTINGTDYEISPLYGAVPSDLSGEEGLFFLNVDGQIAWSEADSTSKGNYALVIAAGTTSGINRGYVVEVVLADGTVAQYTLSGKAFIEDVDGEDSVKDDEATYQTFISGMERDSSAYRVTAEDLQNYAFEITVKSGKITKFKRLERGSRASSKEYDEENMAYGSVSLDESTVIFSVEVSGAQKVESDDIVVGYATDFLVDGEGESGSLMAFDENSKDIAGLVVGFGLTASVPQDSDALIITSVKNTEIDNNDAYVVAGLQGGQKVTYTICDEEENYTGDVRDLQKGNVILLGAEGRNGVVTDFETLYSVREGIKTNDKRADEIYYVAGDLDESKAPTDSKFFLKNNSNLEGDYYELENGISMRNSANYTLVDYSESTRNPEITKKTKSKSIFGSLSKYDSVVFVRYYDDELVEVVVYRYNEDTIEIPDTIDVEAPEASVRGEVEAGTEVSLSAENGTIYYTTNGTVPTTASTQYTGKITVNSAMTIKAIAVYRGISSDVATFNYTIATPPTLESFEKEEEKVETPVETPEVKDETPLEKPIQKLPAKVELKIDTEKLKEAALNKETLKEKLSEELKNSATKLDKVVVKDDKVEEKAPVVKEEESIPDAKEELKIETPVKKEELKIETPVKQEELKIETPVKQEELKIETPVKQEELKIETPVKKEELKIETPVKEEVKAENTLTKDALKNDLESTLKKEESTKETVKDIKIDEKLAVKDSAKIKLDKASLPKLDIKKADTVDALKKGTAAGGAPATDVKKADAGKVNINKATVAEIASLSGVTEALAARIVDYRTKNGEFKSLEDLKKVSGVSDILLKFIGNKITF